MIRILLLGGGAREHVIAEKLKQNKAGVFLICIAPNINPGLLDISDFFHNVPLDNFEQIGTIVNDYKPDFAISGPEAPLARGIADYLSQFGIPTGGPSKRLAQLESSKSFSRDLVEKYKIHGNPKYKVFQTNEGLREYIASLKAGYVIKADGLQGGKGVKVSGDHLNTIEQGLEYASNCIIDAGKVVVEEKLIGQEFSLMSFCDGKTVVSMPPVQDYKRAFEGNLGPNTGGMGSYSSANQSLPFLSSEDIASAHQINIKVAEALFKETGEYYKGIMYGGFIKTENGVKLIEYNVRFGDPEAMNVLNLLETDLTSIFTAIIDQKLDKTDIRFSNNATVCKYVVPEGYPDNPVKNQKIITGNLPHGVKRYFAAVDRKDDGLYMTGSRAIAFVGIGKNTEEAELLAEKGALSISGQVYHRRDIGRIGAR